MEFANSQIKVGNICHLEFSRFGLYLESQLPHDANLYLSDNHVLVACTQLSLGFKPEPLTQQTSCYSLHFCHDLIDKSLQIALLVPLFPGAHRH
jgi:hypothetical protein